MASTLGGELLVAVMVLSAAASHASTADVLTYICVEERSAGWERRDSGELVIGKFKPSEGKFFVRFKREKWMMVGEERSLITLPQIEVTEDGETYTYQSAACDEYGRMLMLEGQDLNKSCEESLSTKFGLNYFGTESRNYSFWPELSDKPQSTAYTSVLIAGALGAWVNSGSCLLAD